MDTLIKPTARQTKSRALRNHREAGSYAAELQAFHSKRCPSVGTRIFGVWETDEIYAVYSYGKHFPMYVYDLGAETWFANHNKYSRSTTSHQRHATPRPFSAMSWVSTESLRRLIDGGGLVESIRRKVYASHAG